jgi:hypothetical protein
VALLAMTATAALGASPAVVTNAGIAAVLIATVEPPHGFYSAAAAHRLVDVLIGGATSLVVLAVIPAHTLRTTRKAATVLSAELAVVLAQVASALEHRDEEAAERALEEARTLDAVVARLREESDLADEAALLTPFGGHGRRVGGRPGAGRSHRAGSSGKRPVATAPPELQLKSRPSSRIWKARTMSMIPFVIAQIPAKISSV